MTEVEKCARYFKSKHEYTRLISEIRKKYEKSGELCGCIIIDNATIDECNAANQILEPKKPFYPPLIKFNAVDFEKGLHQRTNFGYVSLKSVVEAYYGSQIISKKEKRNSVLESEAEFWIDITAQEKGKTGLKWINAMISTKKYGYKTIIEKVHISCVEAKALLTNVCSVINSQISQNPIKLAELSATVTGNSHYFDKTNIAGRLLIKGLAYIADMSDDSNAENIKAIYSEFGIEPDDISGATAAVGIRLYRFDGSEHPAFKFFADSGESCLISLSNLFSIATADTDRKTIYIVENQMVYSALSGTASEHEIGLICTSGQIKLAGMKLIDMLVKSDCEIHYAGDFDPEGLQIADKLLKRYNSSKVHTWRMTADDYNSIEKGDMLPQNRIKKLDSITSLELLPVAQKIREEKRAAYQELLITQMRLDMISASSRITNKTVLCY